jgi:hypothetical protein
MKRPTFLQGVVVAFVFALAGAAAYTTLGFLLNPAVLVKLLIATFAGLYVLYLLAVIRAKTGRLAVPALWLAGAVAAWLLVPGLTLFFITHLGMVWLIRSIYFHSSVLPALLDLGLCGLSLLAAIATARHSHSIFLTIWSCFLIQALFVAIPSLIKTRRVERGDTPEQRFNRALHSAEAAVRRMHTTP